MFVLTSTEDTDLTTGLSALTTTCGDDTPQLTTNAGTSGYFGSDTKTTVEFNFHDSEGVKIEAEDGYLRLVLDGETNLYNFMRGMEFAGNILRSQIAVANEEAQYDYSEEEVSEILEEIAEENEAADDEADERENNAGVD